MLVVIVPFKLDLRFLTNLPTLPLPLLNQSPNLGPYMLNSHTSPSEPLIGLNPIPSKYGTNLNFPSPSSPLSSPLFLPPPPSTTANALSYPTSRWSHPQANSLNALLSPQPRNNTAGPSISSVPREIQHQERGEYSRRIGLRMGGSCPLRCFFMESTIQLHLLRGWIRLWSG